LIRIGRETTNDLVMDHVTISRRHAELFVDEEQNVFLSDLNSMYGTYVNGQRIKESVILKRKDKVTLGDKQFLDWEWEVFREQKSSIGEMDAKIPYFGNKDIRDLIIIYGLIALVLIILIIKI
jgi:pSer/pThr/pTyr-binding forkhead associated (FHA) protein